MVAGKTKHQCATCTYLRAARSRAVNHLLDAVVKKGQAGVLVTDKGALLDEADEYLGLGELGVELLVGTVSAFEKTCRKAKRDCSIPSSMYLKTTFQSIKEANMQLFGQKC